MRWPVLLLVLLVPGAAAACQSPGGVRQDARAVDEWTRKLALNADGELDITNTSGTIDVEGTSDAVVDVRAERVARATTEQGARDLLTHITIRYLSVPDKATLETERITGVLIGASFEVNYHVRAPAGATIRTRTANGSTTIAGTTGRVVANVANGGVAGKAIAGGIEARASNGSINIDVAYVGRDPIDLRATNGHIRLALPEAADANLSATSANGVVDVAGLTLDKFGDQNRRRVRGRFNAGGTPIELNTANGNIYVTAR
jgi:putative adhesin